jgi:hypothetical protein
MKNVEFHHEAISNLTSGLDNEIEFRWISTIPTLPRVRHSRMFLAGIEAESDLDPD